MTENSNILFMNFGPGFGGSVVNLKEIMDAAKTKGYKSYVILNHNDKESVSLLNKNSDSILAMKLFFHGKVLGQLINNTKIAFFRYFLIIILVLLRTLLNMPFIFKVYCFAKKNKIALIFLNNMIQNVEEFLIIKILNLKTICFAQIDFYKSRLTSVFAQNIDFFFSASDYVGKSLLEIGVNKNDIATLYAGVDMARIGELVKAPCPDIVLGKRNICLFGCLLKWKGQEVFLEAVNIIVNEKGIKDWQFFMVGADPDDEGDFMSHLKYLVNKYALSGFVTFTGYKKNIYPLMDKMDIVVHASMEPEPFGRVIIEAMALGKAVIATGIGGPAEIITDQDDGILINPKDPVVLANSIFELLNDDNKRADMGAKAKNKVAEVFTLKNYDKVLEKFQYFIGTSKCQIEK